MSLPLVPKKERISVDEYYRLRHTLLSLRRQYVQAVYADDRATVSLHKAKRLERKIEAIEQRLAYADIDFPFETLTLQDLRTELRRRLSNINLRQFTSTLRQAFKPRNLVESER